MLKPVLLEPEIVNNYLQKNEYLSLATYLKTSFKIERNEAGAPLQYEFSESAVEMLCSLLKKLATEDTNDDTKILIQELFRSLRNYVINPKVQNYLIKDDDFLIAVKHVSTRVPDTLQIILQFLINFIISNEAASFKVADIFLNDLFVILREKLVTYEATALLYNVSLFKPLNDLTTAEYVCLFEVYEHNNSTEFVQFLLEKFINSDNFWTCYKNFGITHRLRTLELIRRQQIDSNDVTLSVVGIKELSRQFATSGNIIFQTISNTDSSNLESFEVSQLLEVIASLCSNEHYLKMLQNDKNLLINCGVLLINIHKLGKESENCFSSIQKLNEIRDPSENISQHPAFGFKAGLIRVIGNLCWKNKIMQDLVREAELIPIILDCCNMDARNPFIMQWVILAIRNLCESNMENQKIIAGMHQQGTISSSTLEEMGLTVHSDGDHSLKIVSLDSLQK